MLRFPSSRDNLATSFCKSRFYLVSFYFSTSISPIDVCKDPSSLDIASMRFYNSLLERSSDSHAVQGEAGVGGIYFDSALFELSTKLLQF